MAGSHWPGGGAGVEAPIAPGVAHGGMRQDAWRAPLAGPRTLLSQRGPRPVHLAINPAATRRAVIGGRSCAGRGREHVASPPASGHYAGWSLSTPRGFEHATVASGRPNLPLDPKFLFSGFQL